jgi:hypothetical protein
MNVQSVDQFLVFIHIIGGKVRYPSQQEKKLDLEDSELSKVVRHLINRASKPDQDECSIR